MPAPRGRAGDNTGPPKDALLSAIAVAAAAMLCCGAAPSIAAALGGVAFASVLGVGAGVLAISLVLALIVVVLPRRADHAPPGGRA